MGWTALLTAARPLFRAPSFALFTDLLTGWSWHQGDAPSPR